MGKINLLDCTLRDGGYINDWEFGKDAIEQIILKLVQTGVEMIEVGFIKGSSYDPNKTMFPNTDAFRGILAHKDTSVSYVGMLDMSSPVSKESITERTPDTIDGIRVIFKRNRINEAYDYCQHIKEMGYDVFVNFVNTDCYTDKEFIEAIERFNVIQPKGMTIVDTFGMIKRKHFMRLVAIADHNMTADIMLCYHGHNNLQQVFGNAEVLVDMNLTRDVVIDACVFGMGRGAGNLCLELFAEHMNENHGTTYRITPMLEIMDEYLSGFYKTKFWGYSLPLYLSATGGCHPNYAVYLEEKHTLTEKAFAELLGSITSEDRLVFTEDKAEYYYKQYFQHHIDDSACMRELVDIFEGKDILLVAPGSSLKENCCIAEKFQLEHIDAITVCINFCNPSVKTDFVFVSNMRRYRQIRKETGVKIIATSNIKEATKTDYLINYSSYSMAKEAAADNAGVMVLKLLNTLRVKGVYIIGMDGFGEAGVSNYFIKEYEFDQRHNNEEITRLISDEIDRLRKYINVVFLTPSKYQ